MTNINTINNDYFNKKYLQKQVNKLFGAENEEKIPLSEFATDKKCHICGCEFEVETSEGRPYLRCKGCGFMTTKGIREGI